MHERDKFTWVDAVDLRRFEKEEDSEDEFLLQKSKTLDFEFKMNHIKQVIKIELTACCKVGK